MVCYSAIWDLHARLTLSRTPALLFHTACSSALSPRLCTEHCPPHRAFALSARRQASLADIILEKLREKQKEKGLDYVLPTWVPACIPARCMCVCVCIYLVRGDWVRQRGCVGTCPFGAALARVARARTLLLS